MNGEKHGTGRLLGELLTDARLCSASFATAYLTGSGWKFLRPALETAVLQRGRRVRLLVGIKDCFTDPEALAAACRLSKVSENRFQIRISRNPRFHAKLYLFEHKKKATVITGSANLTSDGLFKDGEFSLRVDGPVTHSSVRDLQRWFDSQFDDGRDVENGILTLYRAVWSRTQLARTSSNSVNKDLMKALRPIPPAGNFPGEAQSPRPERATWRASIEDVLSDQAEEQLQMNGDWYRRAEPDFICFPNRPRAFDRVQRGDGLLVFDFSRGKRKGLARPATVLGTQSYPRTKDGKHFLVLRYARKGSRRMTTQYTRSLVERGFVKRKGDMVTTLSELRGRKLAIARDDYAKLLALKRR